MTKYLKLLIEKIGTSPQTSMYIRSSWPWLLKDELLIRSLWLLLQWHELQGKDLRKLDAIGKFKDFTKKLRTLVERCPSLLCHSNIGIHTMVHATVFEI